MTETRTLADLIRQRRIELHLTQEQLADRIGLGTRQADVSRLERGRVGLPRRERLERVAAALELPLGELLVRSGWAGADLLDRSIPDVVAEPDAPTPRNDSIAQSVLPSAPSWDELSDDRGKRSARLRAAMDRSYEVAQRAFDAQQRAARTYKLLLEGQARTTRHLGRSLSSETPHDA